MKRLNGIQPPRDRWPRRSVAREPPIHCCVMLGRAPPHCRNRVRLPRFRRPSTPPRPHKLPVEIAKLAKRLHRQVGRAIADFAMIENGDHVMVCVSGGKDSYSLLDILIELRERAPIDFAIVAVNLDQKQPGFPADVLPDYLARVGVDFRIVEQDTYSRRQAPRARGQDDVQPVLAPAPRRRSTASRASSARPRSRSATIATTWCRRCS